MTDYRKAALSKLRAELFGPADGDREVVSGRPLWRYLCGMLFPVELQASSLGEDDEKDPQAVGGGDEQPDPAVALAYDALPSSMGVSFYVVGTTRLECRAEGGRYEPHTTDSDRWSRVPLGPEESSAEFVVPRRGESGSDEHTLWNGRARFTAVFRARGDGHLVTISLVNKQPAVSGGPGKQIEAMLFQCRFDVRALDGDIGEYPTVTRYSQHPEDGELAISYRHRKTYGIGHGCAASWDPSPGPVRALTAEPLPTLEVRGLTTDIALPQAALPALQLQWLSHPKTPPADLERALTSLIDEYEAWVSREDASIEQLPVADRQTGKRMVERQTAAVARMRSGVSALFGKDPEPLRAFRIAQEAMLRQFLWARRRTGPKNLGEGDVSAIDPWASFGDAPKWRPFQLAFQLVVLQSLIDAESPDRDTLDLLWFPTGGGKTEAYLALAAFEMALRRLRQGEAGAGTSVLMRYTLRLLTSQQFERAATLISVLELMRSTTPELGLGETPFRLGLWVGGETTPNHLSSGNERSPGAKERMEAILEDDQPENPFQLRSCPYCGTRIIPLKKSGRESDYGVKVTSTAFTMFCPEPRCPLHDEIPVSMVDEDLYRRPPTFLIGTIDKFARMVWDARSHVFFGTGEFLPPSLIIQDELHLITGPLGTIAGVYEAGIDTLLKKRGMTVKYVAATATIQRAPEQCQALYARKPAIFPPPGLDAADSFFSKEDTEAPGRTFVGAMGHGMYSSLTSLVQVSAAAAALPAEIAQSAKAERDSYWTQVIYHNSRQELGKTTTMLRDDVRTRLSMLQPDESTRRPFDSVEELSANLKGAQISEAIERLQVEWPSEAAIDAVACTSMISVGVDIARLGLMIVKGQPKATSEYIQASSRVGRDRRRLPGIVIALYAATRPRDRSHYETFQPYHQSLYRAVEPATVTPFSPPARDRALHAALVLTLRHALEWLQPRDAGKFDPEDAKQQQLIDLLKLRLARACRDDEEDDVLKHVDTVVSEWKSKTSGGPPPLSFSKDKQFRNLLVQFPGDGEEVDGWPTLNSMRHVDGEVELKVRGEGN